MMVDQLNDALCIVKYVSSGHSKIDKTNVLRIIGSFMKVKSITVTLLNCIKR